MLPRRFDLAICVQVADQLEPTHADSLVASLCDLSDVVLFSAAIPGQGGQGHRNEQWPAYWNARFSGRNFRVVDCLRSRLWNDPRIDPRYVQSAFVYASADRLARNERLRMAGEVGAMPLCVVHPRMFERVTSSETQTQTS